MGVNPELENNKRIKMQNSVNQKLSNSVLSSEMLLKEEKQNFQLLEKQLQSSVTKVLSQKVKQGK